MRAVTWQGTRKIAVRVVPDPHVQEDTDAVVRVTSTAICGSDLHLYEILGPFLDRGDILGHEAMGLVEETGRAVTHVSPGDRVVIPFNISCGRCTMCEHGLQSQCETTQIRAYGTGAALFGYSRLYGSVPGGQAELVRVPHADYGLVPVPKGLPDDRYLFLSDILPTAWQACAYAGIGSGRSVAVLGLGPVGQFAARIARERECDVVAVEPVPERRALAEKHRIETYGLDTSVDDLIERFDGRGPDAVIDAVGMEAHGSLAKPLQLSVRWLPGALARPLLRTAGVDRLTALFTATRLVRRGGTISLAGVYAGERDPVPMRELFDKQVQVRMGQCNVRRWTDELLSWVQGSLDPLGTMDLVTHRLPLDDAPEAYDMFQHKRDGCLKVVLQP